MDEEDIYGEDIYGGVGELDQNASGNQQAGLQTGIKSEHSDLTRLANNSSFPVDNQSADVQGQLQATQNSLEEWQSTFRGIAAEAGLALQPATILSHLRQTQQQRHDPPASTSGSAEEVSALKQRESQLQIQLMEKMLENMELRKHLQTAKAAAEPNVVQVRQLLLDPAVNREFLRIQKALEEKTDEAKRLNEELQVIHFSQESKAGRMLMAKCRTLSDENEEMGRELSEGRVHNLERQLALAKGYAEDMRAALQECEDHATALDEEAEKIQEENFKLRRQLTDAETQNQARRPPPFAMKGMRDGNRPFIPFNNRPPFHSPPGQRYNNRRPLDSGVPPKRGMVPDRRDDGDRFSSRQRVR